MPHAHRRKKQHWALKALDKAAKKLLRKEKEEGRLQERERICRALESGEFVADGKMQEVLSAVAKEIRTGYVHFPRPDGRTPVDVKPLCIKATGEAPVSVAVH